MKRICIILIFLLTYLGSFGQQDSIRPIEVTGFIKGKNVLLRWAPSSYKSWARGNKAGYVVYRIPIVKDGKIIKDQDTLTLGEFYPQPLPKWDAFSDSSAFAIAAEAMYGEDFEVTTTNTTSFIDIVNKSREQESRFSIGLLCADQSFEVARMMGLGLIDSTADPNIAYAYKVVANYADSTGIHEKGYVFIDFKTGNFMPRPFGISYSVNNSHVSIMVPYEPFKGIYTNFELERSTDSVDFKTIIGGNYYSVSTTEDDPKYSIYIDSIKQETATYYYRMRGRTLFDSYGPYSDIIEVQVMPVIRNSPWITDINEIGDKISISWNIQDVSPNDLKGFMIYSSNDKMGAYKPLLTNPLDTNCRFTYILKPDDYSYYKVAVIDQFNRPYFSSPRLFQNKDSIPPSPPIGLRGSFDSTGTVKLQWNYGRESDLLGYQLLYTANPNSEYSLIEKDIIYDSTYMAKFPLDVLSSDVYFEVVALDTRYNTSKNSEPIMLTKPDTIPPSPPVLIVETDSLGTKYAKIYPSRSKDMAEHAIYFNGNQNPVPIKIFEGKILTDSTIAIKNYDESGVLYCVAYDVTGRKATSNKIPLLANDKKDSYNIGITANVNIDEGIIELKWNSEGLRGSVLIYRKMENGSANYELIATIEREKGLFIDKYVLFNSKYSYKFIYTLLSNKLSSAIVLVDYK